jgi:ATP-dependent helicase HrpA
MKFEYDNALPIIARRDEIIATIRAHQVVVIAGETGSGKSTQLPRFCIEAGRGESGLVGITQPRRIAARSVAQRVAEEMGQQLGAAVGFQVRFKEQLSDATRIKFMTDGILLAEIHNDPKLRRYDTVIIDEAHERSLNIDFLLGYLHRLMPRRPELKIIITSATIDTEKFSRHFNDAPVIEVSGRSHPVDVQYLPLLEGEKEKDLNQGIFEAVQLLSRIDSRGDILVFLSGEREIREARDYLEKQKLSRTEVLPLYARLSSAEQQRIFHPGGDRRIILSTNVAETSLTVPRVKFVIDSGLARISRYSHRSKVLRLPIEAISQASANQRAGRCGRLGPGTCIRLFDHDEFEQRPEYTKPEILRTSLASVMLRMAAMDLGDIAEFPFVDMPPRRMVTDAWNTLLELNAMGDDRHITGLGKKLARWPVDVRIGRMLLEAGRQNCLAEILVIAAVLSIQDPRERPLDAQQQADEAHAVFRDPKSDFVSLLKLWDFLLRERKSLSNNQFRKLCRRQFLAWHRVREWFDLHRQFSELARDSRMRRNRDPADYPAIHKALLSGLLSHAGLKDEKGHYQGARGKQFHIFPGSGLFKRKPQWIMGAEQVETSRLYSRINAAIKPEWLEQQGQHLLRQHYFDPHWSRRRGRVMAWEQVSLYGLVVVEKRAVDYAKIDAGDARQIFIRDGLVAGDINSKLEFISSNQRELEAKRFAISSTAAANAMCWSTRPRSKLFLMHDCPMTSAL